MWSLMFLMRSWILCSTSNSLTLVAQNSIVAESRILANSATVGLQFSHCNPKSIGCNKPVFSEKGDSMQPDWADLEKVVEFLKGKLGDDLIALALFGSAARGEMHDLLIAKKLPEKHYDRMRWLSEGRPFVDGHRVGTVPYTKEEFLSGFPSFYLDLGLDAKVLYDTDGLPGRVIVNSSYDAQYRLDLAKMYLRRAKSRRDEDEWDSCVREAQVSVENAAKSILACFRPVPYTHDMENHLRALIRDMHDLDEGIVDSIRQMIALAATHNSEEHVAATCGDEIPELRHGSFSMSKKRAVHSRMQRRLVKLRALYFTVDFSI